jgi:hypothetical protein
VTAPRTIARPALAGAVAALALIALALPLAPRADAALTATDLRISSNAKVVRVVVQFAGAGLTGLERQTDALDPQVADGRGVLRINATGIGSSASAATGAGVGARIGRRPGTIVVLLDAAPNRLKFLDYKVSVPRNVIVIDLWRATADGAATVLDDGCLKLTSWTGTHGRARARGLELMPLFEHSLVLSLRAPGAGGSTLGLRPITATEGTFLPDFSGYATPGRWRGATPPIPGLPRRAMLEAWSSSAKDGSLDCLVQVPVRVIP